MTHTPAPRPRRLGLKITAGLAALGIALAACNSGDDDADTAAQPVAQATTAALEEGEGWTDSYTPPAPAPAASNPYAYSNWGTADDRLALTALVGGEYGLTDDEVMQTGIAACLTLEDSLEESELAVLGIATFIGEEYPGLDDEDGAYILGASVSALCPELSWTFE